MSSDAAAAATAVMETGSVTDRRFFMKLGIDKM